MYHLIGVVYRIRRYTGVYRLPCMLLFPDLFCLVNQFKQKHAAQAVSSQAVEGSTLQEGISHQYIYCKLSLISHVFAQCLNNPKADKQSSYNIKRGLQPTSLPEGKQHMTNWTFSAHCLPDRAVYCCIHSAYSLSIIIFIHRYIYKESYTLQLTYIYQ